MNQNIKSCIYCNHWLNNINRTYHLCNGMKANNKNTLADSDLISELAK